MKRKSLILFLSFSLFSSLFATTDEWQWWFTQVLKAKPAKNFKVIFVEQYRFRKTLGEIFYFQLEPFLLYGIKDRFYLGLRSLVYGEKIDSDCWERIMEPGVVILGKIKPWHIDGFFRVLMYYRIFEQSAGRGGIRIRIGANLLKHKIFTLGFKDEQYYNHFRDQTLDRNRLTLYLNGKLFNKVKWSMWYMHEYNHKRRDLNVLGLDLSATF